MALQTKNIDLTRLKLPYAIEPISFDGLRDAFVTRFKNYWRNARAIDPALPDYDVDMLQSDPAMIFAQVFSMARLLDRARVNDAIKALFGFTATGLDLDHFVLSKNITRKIIEPKKGDKPAIYESDLQLLRRYLLAHDARASGSIGRYLFDAFSAQPDLLDVRVNGFAEHGRRGDIQVVVLGPGGNGLSDNKLLLIYTDFVAHPDRAPDGVNIGVLNAKIKTYDVDVTLRVNTGGPSHDLIVNEARARIVKGTGARMIINGQIPDGFIQSLAFGPNIIAAIDNNNIVIPADAYSAPKVNQIKIGLEVI